MGILDAVLGRNFSTKKFEDLLNDALTELKFSKSDFREEISTATSSVTKLLKDEKKHDKAYREVNIVIQKQNHLYACNIIIRYLRLLIANVDSFKPKSDIPEKYLEAVSSVIFAAPKIKVSSCYTAIKDVRKILLSHFGHHLAAKYLEIRNNCEINPQIIEKLSKEPSLREVRMKRLEEIATKENIVLKLKEASTSTEGTSDKAIKLASEESVEDETRKGCETSDPSGKKKQIDVADAEKAVGNSSKGLENEQLEQEKEGNHDDSSERGNTKQKEKEKKVDVADADKVVGNSSKGSVNKQPRHKKEGNNDSSAERGNMKQKEKEKKIDVANADKAVENSSKSPVHKQPGQEKKGNDDGSAVGGNMEQKGKEKKIDVADADKVVGNSSKDPVDKKPRQEKEGNDDGSAEGGNMEQKGKEKKIDVPDADKAVGNSSKDPVNKQPRQKKEGNDDGSAEKGNMKHKEKEKKIDVADADKAVKNSYKVPVNKQPNQEKEDNDDGSANRGNSMKQKGKEKKIDMADAEKVVENSSKGSSVNKQPGQGKKSNDDGSAKRKNMKQKEKKADVTENTLKNSSNSPENEKSEQEGSDVRSKSERQVAWDSEEISTLVDDIEEWLEKFQKM